MSSISSSAHERITGYFQPHIPGRLRSVPPRIPDERRYTHLTAISYDRIVCLRRPLRLRYQICRHLVWPPLLAPERKLGILRLITIVVIDLPLVSFSRRLP